MAAHPGWTSTPHRTGSVAAVVGARGFIAARLLRALSWAGVAAHGFTTAHPPLRAGQPVPGLRQADVLFYLAGRINPAIAEREPERVARDNTEFADFLRALRGGRGRPVVVLASSGGTVYNPAFAPPYGEHSPMNPTTAYGRAKLEQEQILAAARSWVAPVVLRLANVYGPGQRTDADYGVIGHWMQALRRGEPLRVIGDGRSTRDYVHVFDVTNAMLAVAGRASALRAAGGVTVLNIGSGAGTSLDELHRSLERTVGRAVPVDRLPPRSFDRRDVWLDIRRAAEVLGWRPRIGLAEGLADTWRYHLAQAAVPTAAGGR